MKSFVVTGANKGIGFALVKRILNEVENSFVFLGSRNIANGEKAINGLINEKVELASRVKLLQIDVSNQSSIEKARIEVEQFLKDHPEKAPLEGVVNNAGVFGDSSMKTMLDVNVYGVYNVTKVFAPLVKENGRIVNVSSMLGPAFVKQCNQEWKDYWVNPDVKWEELISLMNTVTAEFDAKDQENKQLLKMGLQKEKIGQQTAYEFSKALCNCVTMIQAKAYPKLTINCCMPGFIFTDMTSHYVNGDKEAAAKMGMKETTAGTVAPFYLLCDPNVQTTGKYYDDNAKLGSML